MGCFWQHKDKLFIIPFDGIESLLLYAEDAMVEMTEDFWVIKNVTNGETLSKEKFFMIKAGKKIENYCNYCKYRLRALNSGCGTCTFDAVKNSSFQPMKINELIFSLKKSGCYEVDRIVFQDEVSLRKIQLKKNKKQSS